jgi:hypothetical protein
VLVPVGVPSKGRSKRPACVPVGEGFQVSSCVLVSCFGHKHQTPSLLLICLFKSFYIPDVSRVLELTMFFLL